MVLLPKDNFLSEKVSVPVYAKLLPALNYNFFFQQLLSFGLGSHKPKSDLLHDDLLMKECQLSLYVLFPQVIFILILRAVVVKKHEK